MHFFQKAKNFLGISNATYICSNYQPSAIAEKQQNHYFTIEKQLILW